MLNAKKHKYLNKINWIWDVIPATLSHISPNVLGGHWQKKPLVSDVRHVPPLWHGCELQANPDGCEKRREKKIKIDIEWNWTAFINQQTLHKILNWSHVLLVQNVEAVTRELAVQEKVPFKNVVTIWQGNAATSNTISVSCAATKAPKLCYTVFT